MTKELLDEFIEKGADLEHDRWSKWQSYLHGLCIEHPKGMMIPWASWERWERQISTKYKDLSDREKESDRHEVRKYLPIIQELETSIRKEVVTEILELLTTPTVMSDTGIATDKITHECIKYRLEKYKLSKGIN